MNRLVQDKVVAKSAFSKELDIPTENQLFDEIAAADVVVDDFKAWYPQWPMANTEHHLNILVPVPVVPVSVVLLYSSTGTTVPCTLYSVPVNSRSICSRTGTTCVMHHYFTTREACVIPTHTSEIIGHS